MILDEVARSNVRANQLRQAILKRAFEGKLVPQDRNDEPASVLLTRIRCERDGRPDLTKRSQPKRAVQSDVSPLGKGETYL